MKIRISNIFMLQWGTFTWKLSFQKSTCVTQSRLVSWVRFGAGAEIHRLFELHSGISQSIAIVVDSLHLVLSSAPILDEQNFHYIDISILVIITLYLTTTLLLCKQALLSQGLSPNGNPTLHVDFVLITLQ